ncbi:hypothetical protein [Streptomyces bobili]|uniref:hypothetical protein n=1 Tax=Streptomyces bobili TaxID=67280 RepID=UPI00378BD17E
MAACSRTASRFFWVDATTERYEQDGPHGLVAVQMPVSLVMMTPVAQALHGAFSDYCRVRDVSAAVIQ